MDKNLNWTLEDEIILCVAKENVQKLENRKNEIEKNVQRLKELEEARKEYELGEDEPDAIMVVSIENGELISRLFVKNCIEGKVEDSPLLQSVKAAIVNANGCTYESLEHLTEGFAKNLDNLSKAFGITIARVLKYFF